MCEFYYLNSKLRKTVRIILKSAIDSYLGISKQISFSVVFVSDCSSEKTLGKKFGT